MEKKEMLFRERKNSWEKVTDSDKKEIFNFAKNYIFFLSNNKTERECVVTLKDKLLDNGFKNIEDISSLKKGDKVYYINRNKNIYAAIIGENNTSDGFNIICSHIDSPRLDLKPNPIYEDNEIVFFKTHYYGGIKKYQWVNVPLSMHGVVIKSSGEKVDISIGEDDSDPVFTIADILPHLSSKQDKKSLKEGIEAEELNIIIGSIPYKTKDNEKVKINILNILYEKYGITEQDFVSAEIEFTPSFEPRELGFDRSLIAGYGHDDRACAYTSFEALLNVNSPKRTSICVLTDKEEIGSMGNTGIYSQTFDLFIDMIIDKTVGNNVDLIKKVFNNSRLLSADVTGAYNPNYPDLYEKNNESYINHGVSIMKYTGSASKGGSSDANAEYVGYIRGILERNNIDYQVSEMGKIGIGGGGTVAYILADRGIDVIDCGIPVLSMHSPFEIVSKIDLYNAYKAYKVFYEDE